MRGEPELITVHRGFTPLPRPDDIPAMISYNAVLANVPREALAAAAQALTENDRDPGFSAVVRASLALTAAAPIIAAAERRRLQGFLRDYGLDSKPDPHP